MSNHRRLDSDALTVDSWGGATHVTSATVGLLAREDETSRTLTFYCPKHPPEQFPELVFSDKHQVCPRCEHEFQQQRVALRDRRASVDEQLRELKEDGDIMQQLQQSMQNWKPGAAEPDEAALPGHSGHGGGNPPGVQTVQSGDGSAATPLPPRYPPTGPAPAPSSAGSANNTNAASQQQQPPNAPVPGHAPLGMPPATSHTPAPGGSPPASMPVPSPYGLMMGGMPGMPGSMVPPPGAAGMPAPAPSPMGMHHHHHPYMGMPGGPAPAPGMAPAPGGGGNMDALALQIQGMQRMQDWMLWQKEQECVHLRARVEAVVAEAHTIRVENALLQEKLHQQEQRMQHELKLLKLAAMQSRREKKSTTTTLALPPSESGAPVYIGGNSTNHSNATPSHSESGGGGATGSQSTPQTSNNNHNNNHMPSWPPVNQGNNYNNNHGGNNPNSNGNNNYNTNSGQRNPEGFGSPSTANAGVKDIEYHHHNQNHHHQQQQQHSNSNNNNINHANSGGNTNRSLAENSETTADDSEEGKDAFDSNSVTWPTNSTAHKQQQQQNPTSSFKQKDGPLTRHKQHQASLQEQQQQQQQQQQPAQQEAADAGAPTRSHPWDAAGAPEPAPAAAGTEEEEYGTVPQNLYVDGEAPPTVPLEEGITAGTSLTALCPSEPAPFSKPPKYPPGANNSSNPSPTSAAMRNVSFVDDAASTGQTVASSTYGEDRQKVTDQVILDPYGDKGHYTGIILKSTGMPHGSGRMMYQEDQRTYNGEWRHGRWHGFGRATFANHDTYEGEYRFDQRHGRGCYSWSDGRVYDGMFKEDKRHGHGKFTWPDGAVYEGAFRNGQREGHGTYCFSDGGRYEGSWKDGRYNGFGICNWEDGRTYKGEWLNGMAHGKGVETYADGSIRHDGQWIEDEPIPN